MQKEEAMKMLMQKAEELKMMAEEYDVDLGELLGSSGEMTEMGDEMEEEEMDSPDIDKAAAMLKALRAQ
jgi:hypothetical protein